MPTGLLPLIPAQDPPSHNRGHIASCLHASQAQNAAMGQSFQGTVGCLTWVLVHWQARAEAVGKGEVISQDAFDSNCITPGTPFMARLGAHLRYFVRKKIAEDPAWQRPHVIFSGEPAQITTGVVQGRCEGKAGGGGASG